MNPEGSLENPEEWDWDKSESRPPVTNRRVVLSVAFNSPDFQLVSSYASKIGKKTSEFVREAALNAVAADHPTIVPFVSPRTTSRGRRINPTGSTAETTPTLAYQVR